MAEKKSQLTDLTMEQASALTEFARANGKDWKTILCYDWLAGKHSGPLQQIRNNFGPTWLKNLGGL